MKIIASLSAGILLTVSTGMAQAQQGPITVGGTASAICSLPTSWGTRTSVGGPIGTFDGNTWTIPSGSFSHANGIPVTGGELALRLTGLGFCNTSHRITLESENGGMSHDTINDAPAGFSIIRQVKYDAHWADDSLSGQQRRVGPGVFDWIPQGPTSSQTAVWVASSGNGIPGSRHFDLRLSIRREAAPLGLPLVAGRYHDVVRITLTPNA